MDIHSPDTLKNWKELLACQFRVFSRWRGCILHKSRGTHACCVPKWIEISPFWFSGTSIYFWMSTENLLSPFTNALLATGHASNWLTCGGPRSWILEIVIFKSRIVVNVRTPIYPANTWPKVFRHTLSHTGTFFFLPRYQFCLFASHSQIWSKLALHLYEQFKWNGKLSDLFDIQYKEPQLILSPLRDSYVVVEMLTRAREG